MKTLGRLLKEYEIANGLPVGRAALRVLGDEDGPDESKIRVYSRWRNEGVVPRTSQIKKLSERLGVPENDLLDAIEQTTMERAQQQAVAARRHTEQELRKGREAPPRTD